MGKKTLECFPTSFWNKARYPYCQLLLDIVLKVLGSGKKFLKEINILKASRSERKSKNVFIFMGHDPVCRKS